MQKNKKKLQRKEIESCRKNDRTHAHNDVQSAPHMRWEKCMGKWRKKCGERVLLNNVLFNRCSQQLFTAIRNDYAKCISNGMKRIIEYIKLCDNDNNGRTAFTSLTFTKCQTSNNEWCKSKSNGEKKKTTPPPTTTITITTAMIRYNAKNRRWQEQSRHFTYITNIS